MDVFTKIRFVAPFSKLCIGPWLCGVAAVANMPPHLEPFAAHQRRHSADALPFFVVNVDSAYTNCTVKFYNRKQMQINCFVVQNAPTEI